MVRCPAAAVIRGVWPLWLIFRHFGVDVERLFAGIVGGVLRDWVLLEGYRLDCYSCGVPVCVLVFLTVVR